MQGESEDMVVSQHTSRMAVVRVALLIEHRYKNWLLSVIPSSCFVLIAILG